MSYLPHCRKIQVQRFQNWRNFYKQQWVYSLWLYQ